jgi:hypothetical protein
MLLILTDEEVDVVLACCIAIGIEVSIGVIAAGEHTKANFRHVVILSGASPCSSEWALLVRSADVELVIVGLERCQ